MTGVDGNGLENCHSERPPPAISFPAQLILLTQNMVQILKHSVFSAYSTLPTLTSVFNWEQTCFFCQLKHSSDFE